MATNKSPDGVQLGLRLIATALALVLFYLAAASTAWNMGQRAESLGLPSLVPDDPDVFIARAREKFSANGEPLSADDLARLHRAARLDPLEGAPFFFLALERLREGRDKDALSLLETARDRNARSREVRILLLDAYLKGGNTGPAVQEIGPLSRLTPELRPALTSLLVNLASNPDTRRASLAVLPSNPLRFAAIREMAKRGASSFMVLDMTRDMRGIAAAGGEVDWAGGVMGRYVARGDLPGARRLWRHFYALEEGDGESGLFDGGFDGLAGSPFGWRVHRGRAGYADIENGALKVLYYGRDNWVFARQLLTLAPGTYALAFKARHGQRQRANLAWQIYCQGGGERLLDLPINPSMLFGDVPSGDFTVPPENCAGQWMTLRAQPMDVAQTRSVIIDDVSIEPAGAP